MTAPALKRQCGACSLCCKLVPVEELGKRAGKRCKHQRRNDKGSCTIHKSLPVSCRFWDCMWLSGADLPRPDRVHYVIDMVLDSVKVTDHRTGVEFDQPVVQVWVDPNYPRAHDDQHLRRYLNECGKSGFAAILRLGYSLSFCLFPPSLTGQDEWVETAPQEATVTTPLKARLRVLLEEQELLNGKTP